MTDTIDALITELTPVLGEQGVLTGDAVGSRAAGIWNSDPVQARVIFRPANTEQVAAVLRACHAAGQPVVTHGGLTGLVEGAIASSAEVILSTEPSGPEFGPAHVVSANGRRDAEIETTEAVRRVVIGVQ